MGNWVLDPNLSAYILLANGNDRTTPPHSENECLWGSAVLCVSRRALLSLPSPAHLSRLFSGLRKPNGVPEGDQACFA